MVNLELLLGLLAIAVAIFFGLREFRKSVSTQLSDIKERIIEMQKTIELAWDIFRIRFGVTGTVERNLTKLGKVKISAEPGRDQTAYLIEIEKPVLKGSYLEKVSKESGFSAEEIKLFGRETTHNVLSPNILRLYCSSADPKICTGFVTQFLNWLNSTYIESLEKIQEFEEPILT